MIYHKNEPREVGYAKEHEEYYRDTSLELSLTHKDSKSIFAGLAQKDLFIFAMAIGKYHNITKIPQGIKKNVSVSAMTEQQKWALLSLELSDNGDVLGLNDEKPHYASAEKYACAGMDILLQELKEKGSDQYITDLETELMDILEK
jgi:hypothetical protein